MLLTNYFRKQLAVLLASDATGLAPAADPNAISLIMADFTPTEDLVLADLTFATFTGSTPIDGNIGNQEWWKDPQTGEWMITLIEPANGWRWEVIDAVNLPQTIYGFALHNGPKTVLFGTHHFDTPITLTEAMNAIDIGKAEIRFVLQPMS